MANKPKIQFPTNIPITITLGKQFWSGEGQYGMSYGWDMTENGVEKSCFVKPYLNDLLSKFPQGSQLTITKREVLGENGKPRTEWQVMLANDASVPIPAGVIVSPPVIVQTPQRANTAQERPSARVVSSTDRGEYRVERVARAREALEDAREALGYPEDATTDEQVRALAISFLIDEQHKGIPGPEYNF